jgi:hypothetical protein
MTENLERRIDAIESGLVEMRGTLTRIGTEVRKMSGWASVHDETARGADAEFAVMKHRMHQVECSLTKIDDAQQLIISKLGGIEVRWTGQLVSVLASAVVVIAGTLWTVLAK